MGKKRENQPESIPNPVKKNKQNVVRSFSSEARVRDVAAPHVEPPLPHAAGGGIRFGGQGFTLSQVGGIRANSYPFDCSHLIDFSSDGRLLVTSGYGDQKAVLWYTDSLQRKSTTRAEVRDTHSITDVWFSPNRPRLATSSADKTVRVWEECNPFPICTFKGHSANVVSVDFHPTNEDLLCSQAINNELKLWSINSTKEDNKHKKNHLHEEEYSGLIMSEGASFSPIETGGSLVRFQPREGRVVAAAQHHQVALYDVDMGYLREKLGDHLSPITSMSWDQLGQLLATVSAEMVNVWRISSTRKSDFVGQLRSTYNQLEKFHSCCFTDPSQLIIGSGKTLLSLDTRNLHHGTAVTTAHQSSVSSLASSPYAGLLASGSIEGNVKLWRW